MTFRAIGRFNTPVRGEGRFDASYRSATGPTVTLPWMSARYFVTGTGTKTVAGSQRFPASGITYSLLGAPSGVTINASTGLVSIDTTSAFAWTDVTIRGTNTTGGISDVVLPLRVLTPTKTIDLGAGQSYWSVSPVPGDIVVVRAGTSTEAWFLNSWAGTAGNPIELVAYPGETCTINVSALTTSEALYAGDTSYLTIRGLVLVGGANVNYGVNLWKSHHMTVEGCTIHTFKRGGITSSSDNATSAHDLRLRGNEVYDCVRENSARNMGSGWGSAIMVDATNTTDISRNLVYENFGEGIRILACDNATVQGNLVRDNYSVNIYVDNGQYAEVHTNKIWSNLSGFYRAAAPAISVLAANEAYPGQSYFEQPSLAIVVTDNDYLSTNVAPFYDGSYGTGGGAGAGSGFTPNTTFTSVDSGWVL